MPGLRFSGSNAGFVDVPNVRPVLLGNSLTGTGTPPAAAIQAGDVICLTTVAALTSSGNVVGRMLLAADVTAVYKEGTPVAGIYGMARDSSASNASGVAQAPPPLGGIQTSAAIPYPYSYAGTMPPDDATGRSQLSVDVFYPGQIFAAPLYPGGGAVTVQHQYDDTLAGLRLSTTAGVTTYLVDVGATTKILRIIAPNMQDPLYNTLVATSATFGCEVFFEVLETYCQALTGVPYSTQ